MAGDPIEGQVLVLAGAKASVPPSRLPDLVDVAQAHLGPRLGDYRQRFESPYADERLAVFFVDPDHWSGLGTELGFGRREADAVRRAHTEQVRRIGSREGRTTEFESALEIRDAVVVGR